MFIHSQSLCGRALTIVAALFSVATFSHEDTEDPAQQVSVNTKGREAWRGITVSAPSTALSDLFCPAVMKSARPELATHGRGQASLLDHIVKDLDKPQPELKIENTLQENFKRAKEELESLRQYAKDAGRLFERVQSSGRDISPREHKEITKEAKRLSKQAAELAIKISGPDKENPAQIFHAGNNLEMVVRQAELSSIVTGIVRSVTEVGELKDNSTKRPDDLFASSSTDWSLRIMPSGASEGINSKNYKIKLRQTWKLGMKDEWIIGIDQEGTLWAADRRFSKETHFVSVCSPVSIRSSEVLTSDKIFRRIFSKRHIKLSRDECEVLAKSAEKEGLDYRSYLASLFKKAFLKDLSLEIPLPPVEGLMMSSNIERFLSMDAKYFEEILEKGKEDIKILTQALGQAMQNPNTSVDERERLKRLLDEHTKAREKNIVAIPYISRMQNALSRGFFPIGEAISIGGSPFTNFFELSMNPKTKNLEAFLTPGYDDAGQVVKGRLSPVPIVTVDAANVAPALLQRIKNGDNNKEDADLKTFFNEALKSSCAEIVGTADN